MINATLTSPVHKQQPLNCFSGITLIFSDEFVACYSNLTPINNSVNILAAPHRRRLALSWLSLHGSGRISPMHSVYGSYRPILLGNSTTSRFAS